MGERPSTVRLYICGCGNWYSSVYVSVCTIYESFSVEIVKCLHLVFITKKKKGSHVE